MDLESGGGLSSLGSSLLPDPRNYPESNSAGGRKERIVNPLMQQKKLFRLFGFVTPRTLLVVLLCAAACSILTGTLLGFFRPKAPAKVSQRTLTFAERVSYQRAIEEVYWRHRIWPKERPDPKPSIDPGMSQTQVEKKVEGYLRDSQALEDYWQQPITPEQLQAEMDRMAQHTKQPEVLRELFDALGSDPFVIAECLARPLLTQRLVTGLKNEDRMKLTRVAWLKQPSQPFVGKAGTQAAITIAALNANYTLPTIAGSTGCINDTWTATSTTNAPDARSGHTAVWTGSEMIVWGGGVNPTELNTGGRYDPSTDSWTATSTTNAPAGRHQHTAVWTGSEMIVWGGTDPTGYLNTGGRYNPGTDSWTATSTTNAPDPRSLHTAVWTGSEMIVWGGLEPTAYVNTGGRYDPGTDSWTATSMTNAPDGRAVHTAVWTSSEMIVWGGINGTTGLLNTGGRYNPDANSWTATSTTNAPDAEEFHTAVWTGCEMIVWGGSNNSASNLNTGWGYNPDTNSWTATSITNAPDPRRGHTAVWTGSEMIVWGGDDGSNSPLNTGGRYDPGTDTWTPTSTTSAPTARSLHTAVWTGSEMIVWGGVDTNGNVLNTGGRYCAAASSTGPLVTTKSATTVASFSTTLQGTVNPNGLSTMVHFQYGTTTNYQFKTAAQSKTGSTALNVNANISGLSASTIYHFRIVATNSAGTTFGCDKTFTTLSATGAPVVTTNPATKVTASSATLNGSVDPHGLSTTVHFQYGKTTSYGSTAAVQTQTGNTFRNVSANISGLSASTIYHFRIVGTNTDGTKDGRDKTFATP
jgi:N-acetylneuraminic acid mutarotase